MNAIAGFYRSTIGKKVVMGVTGLIGVVFVLGHMIGNLQVFQGAAKINAYGAFLHGPAAELLWVVRVVLIAAVVLHVVAAVQLTRQKQLARPVAYTRRDPQVSTLASRTIRWGGALLLIFIPLHILHFTTGGWRPQRVFVHGDVYLNVVRSFRIWWVVLFYVLAMIALGLHLYHGAWSSLRTLGFAKASPDPLHRRIALAIAIVIWLGFTAVPVAVFAGVIR